MPNDLLGQIHSSTSPWSKDWGDFRDEVTGMYLLSGQGGEWDAQHLIREYNRNINSRYKSWTGVEPSTTGLFIDPYNAGFSYQGTGDFAAYNWDKYSIQFDGVDECVNTYTLPPITDYSSTISYWCNMADFNGSQFMGGYGSGAFQRYWMGFSSTGTTLGFTDTSVPDHIDSVSLSGSITTGTWHHLCLVCTGNVVAGSGTATYYLDGEEKQSVYFGEDAAALCGSYFYMGATSFWFAAPGPRLTIAYMNGKIDEVGLWSSALSSSDVSAIYNEGTPQSLASYNPQGWWRMGDGDTYPYIKNHGTEVGDSGSMAYMINMESTDIVRDTP